jgi:hypothetical protein
LQPTATPNELLLSLLKEFEIPLGYSIPDDPDRIGNAAVLLYLLHHSTPRIDARTREKIANLAISSLQHEVDSDNKAALGRLIELWVYHDLPEQAKDFQFRFYVALQWSVGKKLAEQVLADPERFGAQIKAYVLVATAKAELKGLVSPQLAAAYLNDQSLVTQTNTKESNKRAPLELRDCALYSLIVNSKQDPTSYGLNIRKDVLPMRQTMDLELIELKTALPNARATKCRPSTMGQMGDQRRRQTMAPSCVSNDEGLRINSSTSFCSKATLMSRDS